MDAIEEFHDEKWLAKIERATMSFRSEGERAVQRAEQRGTHPVRVSRKKRDAST